MTMIVSEIAGRNPLLQFDDLETAAPPRLVVFRSLRQSGTGRFHEDPSFRGNELETIVGRKGSRPIPAETCRLTAVVVTAAARMMGPGIAGRDPLLQLHDLEAALRFYVAP